MKFFTTFAICLFHITTVKGGWNISNYGFLYKSVRYSQIRSTDYISIVFTTTNHNGILLYGYGDDNFILLELYHAVLRLSVGYIGQQGQEPFVGYVGSGLADNGPHHIEIYRQANSVMMVLDRGTNRNLASWPVISSRQLLFKLDQIFVGGSNDPSGFSRSISLSKSGFVGCIIEALWNNVNLLYRPYANSSTVNCQVESINPLSFVSPLSYMRVNRNGATGLTLNFDIILYLNYSTIIYHQDALSTLNISISNGSFAMLLDFGETNYINAFLPKIKINDGYWHRIIVQLPGKDTIESPIVVFGVDDEIIQTYSSFSYATDRDLKIGGFGFIGCINNLIIDGIPVVLADATASDQVVENGCLIPDRCVPNPCQHSGFCNLNYDSFTCQCPPSYPGYVCDDAYFYLTCTNMYLCNFKDPGKQFIDVDGTGPLDPVPVLCNNMESWNEAEVITQVDNLLTGGRVTLMNEPTTVNIPYALNRQELRLLTLNSHFCTQEVTYECSSSRITEDNVTLLVWTGGDGLVHNYWNSEEVYAACQCLVENGKCYQNKRCNCDADDRVTRIDSTIFTKKEHLPIMAVTAMDISSATGKSARLQVGPLKCYGIGGHINAVTFQEIFSYLPISTINFANPGSIQFEFKTDRAQGNVMIYAQDRPQDEYYVIELTNSSAITVLFSYEGASYTITVVIGREMALLNNLEYHQVFFKINVNKAFLIVDGLLQSIPIAYNYEKPIQVDRDNSPFYVGGNPYNVFSGYRGTIRRLRVDGTLINLPEIVTALNLSPAGVYPGVFSSCLSTPNPCNYGTCVEHFNYYLCDCSTSPYNGRNCENEISATLEEPDSSITYYFNVVVKVTEFVISVAFVTLQNGLLYMLQGADPNVFIALDLYQGNLRLTINLFPKRTVVPNVYIFGNSKYPFNLTDGEPNVVQFKFQAFQFYLLINGKENIIYVPAYSAREPIIDTPRWVYMGNAPAIPDFPSVKFEQFNGCIGGMKFKFKYIDDTEEVIDIMDVVGTIANAKAVNCIVRSGECVGNLTAAPPALLIPVPVNMLSAGGGDPLPPVISSGGANFNISITTSIAPVVTASILLCGFMALLACGLILRWYSRNRGIYITQEEVRLQSKSQYAQSTKTEKPSRAFPHTSIEEAEGWYL